MVRTALTMLDRMRVAWLCTVLVIAGGATMAEGAGEYRTVEVEKLKITFDTEWGSRPAPGYLPLRVDIANFGEAREIEIVGEGTRFLRSGFGPGPGRTEVGQRVKLARGDHVRLTVPVPTFGWNENFSFEIREGGRTLERLGYTGFQGPVGPGDTSALIVVDGTRPTAAMMSGWARPFGAGTTALSGPGTASVTASRVPSSMLPPLDVVLPPLRLPTNWLAYTSLRAVVVGPAEWSQLNEPQRNALTTWAACGGDLILVDSAPQPDTPAHAYFFGRIHRPTAASLTATGLGTFLVTAQGLQDSNLALPVTTSHGWGTIAARGFRLPIPGVGGIPARAYVLILLVFSVIIGPANAWFLRRSRQQVLFVLTAPLISAAFILLLAGYVVAGEGKRVTARIASVTMLDQAASHAVTRSSLSLYAAGLLPSGEFTVPRDMAVFPIGVQGNGTRERVVVDLTERQQFTSGVMVARSPTNVEQIAMRPARERLTFNADGTVVNGLGATVTALVYHDGDTWRLLDERLPPGGKARTRSSGNGVANLVPRDLPLWSRLVHLAQHQPKGSYLAVLDRSPFVDPGVPAVVERGSFHLVLGWPGGQP